MNGIGDRRPSHPSSHRRKSLNNTMGNQGGKGRFFLFLSYSLGSRGRRGGGENHWAVKGRREGESLLVGGNVAKRPMFSRENLFFLGKDEEERKL